ncbi:MULTISPECIES: hypothetical protein [Shewanella]|uniref:hypothetical protein n=1 Tax=Shewanella TaxID=22 RepID=UPI00048F7FD3|nr:MULTISPECIES: hypothetical protein [Shewanella]QLE84431.1 hypothetical protein FLM48_04605 [Shewanella sp. Scap07]
MNIKKTLALAVTAIAISTAVQAAYWEFSIYSYVDDNGVEVGRVYIPCFNRKAVLTGVRTSNKVLVERGVCA